MRGCESSQTAAMASLSEVLGWFLFLFAIFPRALTHAVLVPSSPLHVAYHHGPLLSDPSPIKLSIIFYGYFDPSERASLKAFLSSLSPRSAQGHGRSLRGSLFPLMAAPSVASWWSLTRHYTDFEGRHVSQIVELDSEADDLYSLGKSLTASTIATLVRKSVKSEVVANFLVVIFTSADVLVEGFCMHACGSHSFTTLGEERSADIGSDGSSERHEQRGVKVPYLWVGNSKLQCPGFCAWPFARPEYGAPMAPLTAPNGVGVDGMIISLAKLLVGAATNPLGNAFYEGDDASFGREGGAVCAGQFGEGAYPGYPGEVLLDVRTGASYNMEGKLGEQFLVPWIWNLAAKTCAGQA